VVFVKTRAETKLSLKNAAVYDHRKATSMFTNPDLKIPVLGIIENMSWFTPEQHPDEKYYIFGKGGGHKMAIEFNTSLLGQIPLVAEVGEAAEKGLSVFNQKNKQVMDSFEKIAEFIISKTE
jgi:ATP-binding protein involved in chromosome partitioning